MPLKINITLPDAIAEAKEDAKQQITEAQRNCRDNIKRIRTGAKQIAKLAVTLPTEVDCTINSYWGYQGPLVEFDRKHLALVRKAVGRLVVNGKQLANAEQRLIRVTLTADKYPNVRFAYLRRLPEVSIAEPGDMVCEIVEVKQEARTYSTLVCRRKPAPVENTEPEPQLVESA